MTDEGKSDVTYNQGNMNERKMTIGEVEKIVEKVLSDKKCDATISCVEPNSDGDYCTVILGGDVELGVLTGIAEAVGDEPIVSGEEYNEINLFFRIPDADKGGIGHDNHEKKAAPAIPADMRHKEYLRLDDGVHVEVSDIYDQKVRDVLERGEAVGGDGRKYKIENPENIFPIGDSICVRATCIETGRGDVYGLDFFV